MTTVSRAAFDRKVKDGKWEAETDVNQFGRVQVRSCVSGDRFTVTVTEPRK